MVVVVISCVVVAVGRATVTVGCKALLRYTVAHPHRVSEKKRSHFFSLPGNDSFRSGLRFYCRCFIYFFCHRISKLRRPIVAKFRTVVGSVCCSITHFQKFGGPSLK